MADASTRKVTSKKPPAKKTAPVKLPPHSIDAEQSVLGALLIDNQAWDKIADVLVEHDFYRPDHQLLFNAIAALTAKDTPVDVLTLAEYLKANGHLEKVGGDLYLYELANNTPSAVNIVAYANIVRERSVLRQLTHVGGKIADSGFHPDGRDTPVLLDEAESMVFAIAEQTSRQGGPEDIKDLLANAVERIDTLFHSDGAITGVSTGFQDLDELTSGFQPSDMIVIAGRPSMGKTMLGMNIAEHAALKEGKPVLVFSLEMPGEALATRLLSSLGRIDQHRLRTGRLRDEDWPRITSAVSMLSEAKLFIDDTPAISPSELRARARRTAKVHGQLGLIVVDYLQLMQIPGSRENRTLEISEISRSLKSLAKELNVPVVALSQLNRGLEQRPNKRPIMSDLRESGAIEQDADVIAFIYRDEVYNPESQDKGIAEIIIAKQRNGPIDTVRLTFMGKYVRFENFVNNQV